MLSAEEYTAATGLEAPEGFSSLESTAAELLHARTLQQYRRDDLPHLAAGLFRQALAMQIAYMAGRSGLEGWADPSTMQAGVTLGRFSTHSASQAQSRDNENALLAPAAAALLPTLMAYARSWMGGDCR